MFTDTKSLEAGCLARIRDASRRGVDGTAPLGDGTAVRGSRPRQVECVGTGSRNPSVTVSFDYCGHHVTITAGDDIELSPRGSGE